MDKVKISQISNKFDNIEMFLCYQGIFNPFIDYNKESLEYYICRGVRFNFNFARTIHKYYNIKSENILRSISASYIMNNYLEDEIIEECVPYNFWYPYCPSKDTCIKLLEINESYKNLVYILAKENKWFDILNNFKDYIFINPTNFFEFYDGYICRYSEELGEHFYNFAYDEIDINYSNDICIVNCSSIERIIYFLDIEIPFFNFSIEDIKYNFLLSYYIFKNKNMFDEHKFSLALSNLIVYDLPVTNLLKEHDIFYLFTHMFPKLSVIQDLYLIRSHLKYNIIVVFIMCKSVKRDFYDNLNLLPDLDILSIAEFYNCKYVINDMLDKNKKMNIWYRHLDFKNSKNINPPIQISIEDKINYGNLLFTSKFS